MTLIGLEGKSDWAAATWDRLASASAASRSEGRAIRDLIGSSPFLPIQTDPE
jgi:hypothetical protein